MNCPKCGLELKPGENQCPFCQNYAEPVKSENNNNIFYEEYRKKEKLKEELNKKYGVNRLLILSILELVCCSQIFGVAALILLFLKLNPSISEENIDEINKWKKVIKTILIVGLVIGMIASIFNFGIELLPQILDLYNEFI